MNDPGMTSILLDTQCENVCGSVLKAFLEIHRGKLVIRFQLTENVDASGHWTWSLADLIDKNSNASYDAMVKLGLKWSGPNGLAAVIAEVNKKAAGFL